MLVYEKARQEAINIRQVSEVSREGLESLMRIAARWGASVKVEPLEPGLSGFIHKPSGECPRIYINASEDPMRQRFTLAHEIGHLVERNVVAKDDDYSFVDRRSDSYDLHEFFADEFAGELLMPAEDIARFYSQGLPKYQIAKKLGVSVPALEKRIARLQKNAPKENYGG